MLFSCVCYLFGIIIIISFYFLFILIFFHLVSIIIIFPFILLCTALWFQSWCWKCFINKVWVELSWELIKLLWKRGKSRRGGSWGEAIFIGGAKYFITPSIAHCDWVVYVVNTGDKPMGHWLLVVPAWWSLAKKENKNILSVRRPTGKMPGMPDYQSSPAPQWLNH